MYNIAWTLALFPSISPSSFLRKFDPISIPQSVAFGWNKKS